MKLSQGPRFKKPRLDWRAYFEAFCEAHGKWPVMWGHRLLFQDGWTYAATSHQGPEWPPPSDKFQLQALKRIYWTRRRMIVSAELEELRETLTDWRQAQAMRAVPLKQSRVEKDEEGRRVVVEDLDFKGMQLRIDWLRKDVEECDEKLKGLGQEV